MEFLIGLVIGFILAWLIFGRSRSGSFGLGSGLISMLLPF